VGKNNARRQRVQRPLRVGGPPGDKRLTVNELEDNVTDWARPSMGRVMSGSTKEMTAHHAFLLDDWIIRGQQNTIRNQRTAVLQGITVRVMA
jgi:hypothetical protein